MVTKKPTARQIKAAADRIRNEYPVEYEAGNKTTDKQIRAQNAAIRAQLEEWGLTWSTTNEYGSIVEGRHVWHTCVVDDQLGPLSGRWGDNPVEVELHLRMYTEAASKPAGYFNVVEDEGGKLYEQMKASRAASERQAKAIAKKAAKIEAKHTDTTTSDEFLASTVTEGMLF